MALLEISDPSHRGFLNAGCRNAFILLRHSNSLHPSIKLPFNILFIDCAINGYEVNKLVQNFPGAFELLPSRMYYDFYPDPEEYPFNDERDIDGNGVKGELNYDQLKILLQNLGKNMPLFNKAEAFHDALDPSFSNTNGVKTYLIAGSGLPTIGRINDHVTDKLFGLIGGKIKQDARVINGDNTVPIKSATLGQTEDVYYVKQEHTDLPTSQALTMAVDLLNGQTDLIAGVQKDPFSFEGK